jgi:hypothetical protein
MNNLLKDLNNIFNKKLKSINLNLCIDDNNKDY